jgi:asparagine synthase (glutamine-hydrolysing)
MCGITGYINVNSKTIKDTSTIIPMLRVQKHRGPDDSGIRAFNLRSGQSLELPINEPCSLKESCEGILGFNRLSILDLSSNGHQPMVSPDNKVILTLNGEIYNAFEYKSELEKWGYRFKSTTDTEIVLALYLKCGFEEMLSRLNGMFAIVVVDLGKNEVFVARDRFGIKPMYYIFAGEIFAFSSELKSFRYLDGFTFRLKEEQLDEYLLFRNNMNGTLFKEVQSLSPGHYLSFNHDKGLAEKRYFDINNYARSFEVTGNLESYSEMLETWLSKSVTSQLMSDVKLGCQLSGGIDSSVVTWLANRNSDRGNFEAVSIVFNDQRFSEEEHINRVIESLGIISHKFLLNADYYFDNIESATWHLETPINHPNTTAIYKLSQSAKDYVTVLLSGEGADEVFGGYGRFYEISYPFQPGLLLHEIKKNILHPLKAANYFNDGFRAVMATSFMTSFLAKRLLPNFSSQRAAGDRISLYHSLSGSLFDRQVKYEIKTYLPDLLIRQDKMSMAHSIENRVPFLDNEVVKNAFTIPEKYLMLRKCPEGYNTEKYLLKIMTARIFGNDFAFRNKRGFDIPLREFFLNTKFDEYLNDKIMPNIRQRNLFNHKIVLGWASDIKNLKYSTLEALWVIVAFEIWASIYLDGNNEDWHTRH